MKGEIVERVVEYISKEIVENPEQVEVTIVEEGPDEVIAEIEGGLADPKAQSEVRRQTAAQVFAAPGRAAERVAEIVRWSAGLRPAPPADVEFLST